jgi:hypothetical protein
MTKISQFIVDAPKVVGVSIPVYDPNEALPADQNKRVLLNNLNSAIAVADKAAADVLIADEELLEGFHYKIANLPAAGDSIVLPAISKTEFGRVGFGIFKNPDFGDSGNYSGVAAVTTIVAGTRLGIWTPTIDVTVTTGQIVIWNGFHYQCTNAANVNGTNPYVRTTAYTLLPKTAANVGYITESDEIKYDYESDKITYRRDKRYNIVENILSTYPDVASDHCFQWGKSDVNNNIVSELAELRMANFNGYMTNNNFLKGIVSVGNLSTADIHNNIIAVTQLSFVNEPGSFTANTIIAPAQSFDDIPLSASFDSFCKDAKHSTFSMSLDLSTYSSGTDIDSISSGLAKLIGQYRLLNENGSTLDSMSSDYSACTHTIEFIVENGNSQIFSPQAISGATFHSFIGSAGNKTIVGRANGGDSILIRANGSYFEIYQVNNIA